MKKLGHSNSVFTHKSSVEVDGDIHMQSDAEVTDYSIKTLSEEIGVETVFAFSSDGTLVGTVGDSIVKNEDGMYTYTVYCPVNMK